MLTIYTRRKSLEKQLDEWCRGKCGFQALSPEWADRPARAEFVITRARLSVPLERWAASLGALVIQIPESIPYLIDKACEQDVRVVGSEYAKVF